MVQLEKSIRGLLEGKNFAFVATLSRDGSPQVTPNWIDTDGEYIMINTSLGTAKHENTKRDPRITVAVAEQANPYNFATIWGKVVEQIAGKAAEDHIDMLAKKYMGADEYPNRRPGMRRVILKIKPERIFMPPWRQAVHK